MTASPRSSDAAVDKLFRQTAHHSAEEGIWIGVDFGTTNSTCAVWDSNNGRAKWIRLPPTLSLTLNNGKKGRTMPSEVLFGIGQNVKDIIKENESALVGQAVVEMVDSSLDMSNVGGTTLTFQEASDALVTSVKRIFGMKPGQLRENHSLMDSLPLSVVFKTNDKGDEQVFLKIRPINTSQDLLLVTPLQVTAILLKSLREAAQKYLDTEGQKKKLGVPGRGVVRNCVVGVPAHFGQAQRKLMEQACRQAGFDGSVSTITESTAASMSYGLFTSSARKKAILVFDMGGGTTDLTICEMNVDTTFRVIVAEGYDLGGDDMDEALLQMVLQKYTEQQQGTNQGIISTLQRRCLLRSCRKGKEHLCGNVDEDKSPAEFCTIDIRKDVSIQISWQEFNDAIEPLIQRAQSLVQQALDRYASISNTPTIQEVVLVGGATRVPEVRSMLREIFPHVELCTSVHADSAVAQGAAIQAALVSGLVLPHELKSALMLDALPHSIGVQLDDGSFFSILEKDSPLPAMGFATFTLADVHQPGVTVLAVEHVGNDLPLETIGEFTFLLRRLTEEQLLSMNNTRSVDIGMTMETDGKFICSIFDPNDPEHQAKKRRYQKNKAAAGGGVLDYHKETAGEESSNAWTMEEIRMLAVPILLFVLYVFVKLSFHEPLVMDE